MKLIIDINEEVYKKVIANDVDEAENIIKWYSATLVYTLRNSTPLQAELEEIKAEILKLHPISCGKTDYGRGVYEGKCWLIDKSFKIIDRHIKEIEQ